MEEQPFEVAEMIEWLKRTHAETWAAHAMAMARVQKLERELATEKARVAE